MKTIELSGSFINIGWRKCSKFLAILKRGSINGNGVVLKNTIVVVETVVEVVVEVDDVVETGVTVIIGNGVMQNFFQKNIPIAEFIKQANTRIKIILFIILKN